MITASTNTDWPRMAEIWESAVRATHDFLSAEDFEYYKARIMTYFGQVNSYLYKTTDGITAAFIGIADGNIEMLFVDNDFRGKGIGSQLVAFAVEELGANKVDVNEQNHLATGFYIRMGFRIVGRSPQDGDGKDYPLLHMRI